MGNAVGWGNFLVATAGAAAALAGLVFVALSINLNHILKLPGVTGRAAETIVLLAGALVASLAALVPFESPVALGRWLILIWVPLWGLPTVIQYRSIRQKKYWKLKVMAWRFLLHQFATLPLLVAGLSLYGYLSGGLRWLAVALIFSLVIALLNARVLLVEIVR